MTNLELQQIKLNQFVENDFGRIAVILEGRDTAGTESQWLVYR